MHYFLFTPQASVRRLNGDFCVNGTFRGLLFCVVCMVSNQETDCHLLESVFKLCSSRGNLVVLLIPDHFAATCYYFCIIVEFFREFSHADMFLHHVLRGGISFSLTLEYFDASCSLEF